MRAFAASHVGVSRGTLSSTRRRAVTRHPADRRRLVVKPLEERALLSMDSAGHQDPPYLPPSHDLYEPGGYLTALPVAPRWTSRWLT